MAIKSTHSLSKKQKFDIFLPVIDETFSLVKTIEIIEKYNSRFISQYIIVISKTKTTIASKITTKKLKKKYKKKLRIVYQKEKYIGGALKEVIKIIKSSHFILMASANKTRELRILEGLRFDWDCSQY